MFPVIYYRHCLLLPPPKNCELVDENNTSFKMGECLLEELCTSLPSNLIECDLILSQIIILLLKRLMKCDSSQSNVILSQINLIKTFILKVILFDKFLCRNYLTKGH